MIKLIDKIIPDFDFKRIHPIDFYKTIVNESEIESFISDSETIAFINRFYDVSRFKTPESFYTEKHDIIILVEKMNNDFIFFISH